MQGSCRHSPNFSFLCFLFLSLPPDFLSLLFLSFFLPFLPFFCFLPCFSLLSSPHLFLSIPISLFPHLYFSVSPPSISVTSLGLSPRALRYSLLGVSGDGIQRKGPRSRLPSSSQAIAGCRLKCPQDSSIKAFPHHPERALCVPNFPGISRKPRRTMPHIVSPILSGGHLTHLLQTLLILTLGASLDFSSHPQTSCLGTFQRLTPSPQPQRPHLGPGQAAAAPGTLHTACRSPRRYIPTWASKRRCQRAH